MLTELTNWNICHFSSEFLFCQILLWSFAAFLWSISCMNFVQYMCLRSFPVIILLWCESRKKSFYSLQTMLTGLWIYHRTRSSQLLIRSNILYKRTYYLYHSFFTNFEILKESQKWNQWNFTVGLANIHDKNKVNVIKVMFIVTLVCLYFNRGNLHLPDRLMVNLGECPESR